VLCEKKSGAAGSATKIKQQLFVPNMIQKDKVGYAVFPKIRIIWIAYLSVPFWTVI
jgi:hypothetical protein